MLGKLALTTIPPLVLAGLRVASAAVVLELIRRAAGQSLPAREDRGIFFLLALLGVSLNQIFFILGLSLTTAINTAVLTATIPVFTLAVALVLRHERLRLRPLLGLVFAFAGALVLLDVQRFDWRSDFVKGDLLLLANCLSYSFYLVLGRPVMARYRPPTAIASGVSLRGPPDPPRRGPVALPIRARHGDAPRVVEPGRDRLRVHHPAVPAELLGSGAHACLTCRLLRVPSALDRSRLAIVVLNETLTVRTAVAAALIFAGLGVTRSSRPAVIFHVAAGAPPRVLFA